MYKDVERILYLDYGKACCKADACHVFFFNARYLHTRMNHQKKLFIF